MAGERDETGLITVGRIGPAHGNRGDVFVEPWTDLPEVRFAQEQGSYTPMARTTSGRATAALTPRRLVST